MSAAARNCEYCTCGLPADARPQARFCRKSQCANNHHKAQRGEVKPHPGACFDCTRDLLPGRPVENRWLCEECLSGAEAEGRIPRPGGRPKSRDKYVAGKVWGTDRPRRCQCTYLELPSRVGAWSELDPKRPVRPLEFSPARTLDDGPWIDGKPPEIPAFVEPKRSWRPKPDEAIQALIHVGRYSPEDVGWDDPEALSVPEWTGGEDDPAIEDETESFALGTAIHFHGAGRPYPLALVNPEDGERTCSKCGGVHHDFEPQAWHDAAIKATERYAKRFCERDQFMRSRPEIHGSKDGDEGDPTEWAKEIAHSIGWSGEPFMSRDTEGEAGRWDRTAGKWNSGQTWKMGSQSRTDEHGRLRQPLKETDSALGDAESQGNARKSILPPRYPGALRTRLPRAGIDLPKALNLCAECGEILAKGTGEGSRCPRCAEGLGPLPPKKNTRAGMLVCGEPTEEDPSEDLTGGKPLHGPKGGDQSFFLPSVSSVAV